MSQAALTDFRRDIEDLRGFEWATDSRSETLPSLSKLEGDELDVVGLVVERLSLGRGIYGQWVASADLRDHAREALDEELDDVVYRAMRTVIQRRGVTTFAWTQRSGFPAAVDLCSHTGHAGGREGHSALIRSARPWWKRWLSR